MLDLPIDILVVDDEAEFADALAMRLEARGHRATSAFDGPAGLAELDRRPVDVVVLDILMPGMDGIRVLREIKARHPLVEVILLTGHGDVETAVRGMKGGAFDYVLKPPVLEDLLAMIRSACQRKSEQEERIRQAQARSLTRRTGDV